MPASLILLIESMWQAAKEPIENGLKYRISVADGPLSYRSFLGLLQRDSEFAAWYSTLLAESGFNAFYWELPPLTSDSSEQMFEFVLIDAPALARMNAEPAPFQAHFDAATRDSVLVFPNLGGDATLIVPRPRTAADAFAHLAAFLRTAPQHQVTELWQRAAATVYRNVTSSPRWLSTAGLGVAWLHVRIDTRPKYYSYEPYTHTP